MADALASGASVRKDVGVQVPPSAPKAIHNGLLFYFITCMVSLFYACYAEWHELFINIQKTSPFTERSFPFQMYCFLVTQALLSNHEYVRDFTANTVLYQIGGLRNNPAVIIHNRRRTAVQVDRKSTRLNSSHI